MERDSRKIIKRLEAEGWTLHNVVGSHHTFKHPDFSNVITVPHPKKDLQRGLALKLAKLAGWNAKGD